MTYWEVTDPLSGQGDYAFLAGYNPFKVGVTISDLDFPARELDVGEHSRYSFIGWWTFIDYVNGSEQLYAVHPVFWIEFVSTLYLAPANQPWYTDGVYGIHYNLYGPMSAVFTFAMP